jgi:hypothetical protein
LAAFCWTKSLLCKDAFLQGFCYSEVFPEDSAKFAIQKNRFPASCPNYNVPYRSDAHQTKASSIRTTWIPPPDLPLCREASNCSTCIRPNDSVGRPDNPQCSIKPHDFFPKHKYGKIAATVRTTWIPVRTTISTVRTREASIWKLLAVNVRSSGRQGITVRMWLSYRKDLQRNFQNFGRTVVRPDGL